MKVFFNFWIFLLFFCYFLFRVGSEPIGMIFIYFLSFSAFQDLFWLEKKLWWCFLIFWIFLEFSIMGRVGTHQNDFFFLFSLFLGLSQPLLAWKETMMVFSNFLNLFAIFLEFSITSRVGTHRNDFFFIFSLSWPFPTYLDWIEAMMVFFNFLNFFAIFLEFSITCRGGTHRNDLFFYFFIFTLSGPFLTYFGLKRSYDGVF